MTHLESLKEDIVRLEVLTMKKASLYVVQKCSLVVAKGSHPMNTMS
jgi:hypothetical protein